MYHRTGHKFRNYQHRTTSVCPGKAELEGYTSRQCSPSTTIPSISSCGDAQKQAQLAQKTECHLALEVLLLHI